VDAIKENHILSLLHEIKLDCIVIFITHRITTCSRCDHILVLDGGEIVADGSHKQLLESKTPNLYQTFWNIQVLGG
jgi:ATP-binding cassette subfamily B protein